MFVQALNIIDFWIFWSLYGGWFGFFPLSFGLRFLEPCILLVYLWVLPFFLIYSFFMALLIKKKKIQTMDEKSFQNTKNDQK